LVLNVDERLSDDPELMSEIMNMATVLRSKIARVGEELNLAKK
jgi:hypothetical protein